MKAADLPANENERLAALKRYRILDTESEQDLEEIVQLASAICQTPISLISLIDEDRQWFKARTGLEARETARELSFCAHGLLQDELLVIENTLEDDRFADNPLVTSNPKIRFYAGAPLVTPDGFRLGSLCVVDQQPRKLSAQQLFALKTLSKQVITHFELSLQNTKLLALSKLQARFLSILSHDMKNPLIGIDDVLDLMATGQITVEDFKELATGASSQVKLVINLLNDIMDWAQQGDHPVDQPHPNLALGELVADCVRLTGRMAADKGTSIEQLTAPGLQVSANGNILKFIIRNLLTNAIKFTANGRIRISAETLQDHCKLTVTDTGTGMSQQQIDKLLNPNSRYTSDGTNQEKGSGIGLLLCQEFIRDMGGELTIASTPGAGSSFSFTIANRPPSALPHTAP